MHLAGVGTPLSVHLHISVLGLALRLQKDVHHICKSHSRACKAVAPICDHEVPVLPQAVVSVCPCYTLIARVRPCSKTICCNSVMLPR